MNPRNARLLIFRFDFIDLLCFIESELNIDVFSKVRFCCELFTLGSLNLFANVDFARRIDGCNFLRNMM